MNVRCLLRPGIWLVDVSVAAWQALLARPAWPWVAALTFVWLASTTWVYPLLLPDEGRYVGIAWHMLHSGDYLTPRLDGLPFFHKPALFYWLTAGALAVCGENAWAGRLVSVLSATGLVTVCYGFLRRYAGQAAACRTALILAVQPFLFGAAHYANMDMLVAVLMSLTILSGAQAVICHERAQPGRRWVLLMYVFAAAGFLAKGLIGVVLPGAVLFFWLWGRRRYRCMGYLLWWPAILLCGALALPWMLLLQDRYPGFFDYYLIHQQFQRFLEADFNNPYPFWFYGPVLLLLCLPWSVQLWRWLSLHGPLLPTFVAPSPDPERLDRRVLRGLMLSWLLVIVLFFSIPTSKLVGYVIAALPPLAWFIQETFEQRQEETAPNVTRSLVRHALLAAVLCLGAVFALLAMPQRSSRPLAQVLASRAQPGDQLVMYGQFAYDLPLYANWRAPVIVVDHWSSPKLAQSDDWRRELLDAGRFEPAHAKQVLWLPARLRAYLCQPERPTVWVVAWLDEIRGLKALAGQAPLARADGMGIWRAPADPTVKACVRKPKSAPAKK